MTEALALGRRDEGKKNIAGQLLLYAESRLPFDTPAAVENNSGSTWDVMEFSALQITTYPKPARRRPRPVTSVSVRACKALTF